MGKILIFIIATAFIIGITTACSSECADNKNSIPLAGFYSATTKKAITIDSISVYGVGAPGDSMILKVGKAIKQVYLPFRINSDNTTFVIHYDQKKLSDPALNDTISFRYKSYPFFVSAECGATYFFEIEKVDYTKHILDSIAVKNTKITNVDIEAIQLYMTTQTPTP